MNREKQPVLLLAYSGFVIRNLLLGKFAEEVIKERPLVVAVQNPEDPLLQEIIEDKPITLIPFPTNKHPKTRGRFSFNFLLYYMKRGEQFSKNQYIEKRLSETKHTWLGAIGIEILEHTGNLLKKIGVMRELEKAYIEFYSDLPTTREWESILKEWNPCFVFSSVLTLSNQGYESFDLIPIIAARKQGVPAGTLVQSWDNLTVKSCVIPDWLIRYWSWSESMTAMLRKRHDHIDASKISIIGSPQFDFHVDEKILDSRESYFQKLGLDPARPMILIGTGTKKRLPGEHKTVVHFIRALCQEMPECQIVLRFHPKDDLTRWEPFKAELKEMQVVQQKTAPSVHMDYGGFTPSKEFYYDQINTLKHADIVMNSSSTLTVDSAILNRPVICFAYDAEPTKEIPEGHARLCVDGAHYEPLTKTGGVKIAYTEKNALEYVRQYLKSPELDESGRAQIVEIVASKADGLAGVRLAHEMLSLLKEESPRKT